MASRRKEFFPEVTDEQWNDWHWQVKNRIETLDQLKKYIRLTPDEEEGIRESLKTLRMAITPYYLYLLLPKEERPLSGSNSPMEVSGSAGWNFCTLKAGKWSEFYSGCRSTGL